MGFTKDNYNIYFPKINFVYNFHKV